MPCGSRKTDIGDLRAAAREKIAAGELPSLAPLQLYAGHGEGQSCALCGAEVEPQDVLYEVEMSQGGTLWFHLACHAAWQLECVQLRGPHATQSVSKND